MMNPPIYLDRFRQILGSRGDASAQSPETILTAANRDTLYYTPFEYVNGTAKLSIVGITPGPEQLRLSYRTVADLLKRGVSDDQILLEAKKHGAFGGPSMRPNLLKMMRHFGFAKILEIESEELLWGKKAHLFHATSVVPHAAFRDGKMFAGSFSDVLASPVFRACFERDFVASLRVLPREALFIGLGPTPLAALDWCAQKGFIQAGQVLGAFAHPSSSGGSQVDVFLGLKSPTELKERDPVRRRLPFLLSAYGRMKQATANLQRSTDMPASSLT
jgi:hypothetical protein